MLQKNLFGRLFGTANNDVNNEKEQILPEDEMQHEADDQDDQDDEESTIMTPQIARNRNLCYSSRVYVNITQVQDIIHENGKVETQKS